VLKMAVTSFTGNQSSVLDTRLHSLSLPQEVC